MSNLEVSTNLPHTFQDIGVVTPRTPERSRTPNQNIARRQRECTGVGKPDPDSEQRLRSNGLHPVPAANLVLPWQSRKVGPRVLVGAQLPPEIMSDEKADPTLPGTRRRVF